MSWLVSGRQFHISDAHYMTPSQSQSWNEVDFKHCVSFHSDDKCRQRTNESTSFPWGELTEMRKTARGRDYVTARRYSATADISCNQKPAEQWREDFRKCPRRHGKGHLRWTLTTSKFICLCWNCHLSFKKSTESDTQELARVLADKSKLFWIWLLGTPKLEFRASMFCFGEVWALWYSITRFRLINQQSNLAVVRSSVNKHTIVWLSRL